MLSPLTETIFLQTLCQIKATRHPCNRHTSAIKDNGNSKQKQHKADMVHWAAIFEWSGSLCGLMGAFLLATHTRLSRYGWVAFFVANIAMVGFALGIERYGLLVQQIGFMATSLLGMYRAGFTLPFHRFRSFRG